MNDNFTSSSGTITAAARVTMSGSVQQITDVSPTSFCVDLVSLVTLDAIGAEWGASADIANSYFLNFTLTTESVMDLSEPLNVGNSSTQDQCYLRSADFSTSIPLPCFDDGSFDQSFTLGPGILLFIASRPTHYSVVLRGDQRDNGPIGTDCRLYTNSRTEVGRFPSSVSASCRLGLCVSRKTWASLSERTDDKRRANLSHKLKNEGRTNRRSRPVGSQPVACAASFNSNNSCATEGQSLAQFAKVGRFADHAVDVRGNVSLGN